MEKLEYNKIIIKILEDCGIPKDEGLIVLTSLWFDIKPKIMFETPYYKNILTLLEPQFIFERDELYRISWLIPLFGDKAECGFEWIKEWMDLFKKVNPSRRGDKAECIKRFTDLFKRYPLISKNDVFKATKIYLAQVNPAYCKKSHKFIWDMENESILMNYIDELRHENEGINDSLN